LENLLRIGKLKAHAVGKVEAIRNPTAVLPPAGPVTLDVTRKQGHNFR